MKLSREIDPIDIQILNLLSQDARKAYSAIAEELRVSNTMVHQRVNKMIKNQRLRTKDYLSNKVKR